MQETDGRTDGDNHSRRTASERASDRREGKECCGECMRLHPTSSLTTCRMQLVAARCAATPLAAPDSLWSAALPMRGDSISARRSAPCALTLFALLARSAWSSKMREMRRSSAVGALAAWAQG